MTGHPCRSPGVEWLAIEGDVLAFDGDLLHLLPGSGAAIWRELDGARDLPTVAADLAACHPEVDAVDQQVRDFVTDLVQRGLVVLLKEPAGNGLRVPGHVAWTLDEGVVVLADTRSGARRALSVTGSQVWLHLADSASTTQLLQSLAREFPDAPADMSSQVEWLVEELLAKGLLTRVGSGGSAGG